MAAFTDELRRGDTMNSTIDYYNRNADQYYWATVSIDMDATRKKFAAYLPAEAYVADLGCGSGRDVMCFSDMGHNAFGIDASEELIKLARERLEIKAFRGDMSSWITPEPCDGIWCCASLFHLNDVECERVFANLNRNLKHGGVLYFSVKTCIETGTDETGRYFRNFTEDDISKLVSMTEGLEIKEQWYTADSARGQGSKWLNILAVRSCYI